MGYAAPYAGVKVIDLSQGVAGPYCAMLLAQYGANVIKVETPHGGGDWARILGRRYGDHSAYSVYGTLGKRSLALDLKAEDGKLLAELTAAEKEIAAQVEDLKISIAKQRLERDLMAGNLERGLLQRYEMIFRRRNGLAVAEARGGTCQGCRMRLPPQLYNQVQRHDSIHFCPNCQKLTW